jgi:hypothetical protein
MNDQIVIAIRKLIEDAMDLSEIRMEVLIAELAKRFPVNQPGVEEEETSTDVIEL